MAYHKFLDEYSQQPYGMCEVFEVKENDVEFATQDGEPLEPGWYWWACFPGCMPDSDPTGPFPTEDAACDNAGVC